MKKLFIIAVLFAAPAWGQYYPDTGEAGNYAAVQQAQQMEQERQMREQQQQINDQQVQIEQMQRQQQYQNTEYVPVYGNGTEATQ